MLSLGGCHAPVSGLLPRQAAGYRVERDLTYAVVDGMPLRMDVYYPAHQSESSPAVIYVHGGGWYSGDKTSGSGQSEIPRLANAGYVVAAINYRLAPSFKFPAQIEDVTGAIRYLRDNAASFRINPTRIGLFGDSAGGHLAALAGLADDGTWSTTATSARVQAVVDIYGPADLPAEFGAENSDLITHVFGTSDENSLLVRQASPVNHVTPDDPPFLIIHGDHDSVVPLAQSETLYQELTDAGVEAHLVVIQNCDHGFRKVGGQLQPTRQEITRLIVAFFDRHLKTPLS